MTAPDPTGVAAAMAVTLFVGCAVHDADESQKKRIKEKALPFLEDMSLPASEAYRKVMETVRDILGPGWSPHGEWLDNINSLLGAKKR